MFIRAIRVVEFSDGGYKIRKILHKNQHSQRKLLNFEFGIYGEQSKIGPHFINKVIYKLFYQKMSITKKCAPKLIFFNENKLRKIRMSFVVES
jgi:hypothetical protein